VFQSPILCIPIGIILIIYIFLAMLKQ